MLYARTEGRHFVIEGDEGLHFTGEDIEVSRESLEELEADMLDEPMPTPASLERTKALTEFLKSIGMTYEQFEAMGAPDMESLDRKLLQRRYEQEGRVLVKDVIRTEGKRKAYRSEETVARVAYKKAGDSRMREAFEAQMAYRTGENGSCVGCAA